MIDRMVKIPSIAVAAARLRALGLDELVGLDEDGNVVVRQASERACVDIKKTLLLVPGVDDANGKTVTPAIHGGPHLMIRFFDAADTARAALLDDLPVLEVVPNPGTVGWAK